MSHPEHPDFRHRSRYVKLTRNIVVSGQCSITIPLTFEPIICAANFTDDVNDPPPMPTCVPWIPDVLNCEIVFLGNPIVLGPDGQYTSYQGITLTWQINGPTQTRSVEWIVEGLRITP